VLLLFNVCLTLSIFFQGKHSPGVTESSGGKTGPGVFSQPSDYYQKLIAPEKNWEMVAGVYLRTFWPV